MDIKTKGWTHEIKPQSGWFNIQLKEIWEYRDLISILVKRDIIALYKQTVLGPLWLFLGPLFTVVIYTFVFGQIAQISTDEIPAPLFYLAGITLWNYFQSCFNGASSTFSANVAIFGKVYFPRLVTPISLMISNLLKLSFQFLTYIGFLIYYYLTNHDLYFHFEFLFLIPIIILVLAMIAMGMGIIVSSFTSKYRDLTMIVGIGITLLMYASPIMYPLSALPPMYKPYLYLNPIAPLIEVFRFVFTGTGVFDWFQLFYSIVFGFVILIIGIFVFNHTEKTFMDTV